MHLPTRRNLLAAAAAGCAAALIPVAALAATTTEAARGDAGTPPCRTAGLVIWLEPNGDNWAGGFGYNLNFTNLSGHACTLHGTPGVSTVSLTGQQIGHSAAGDYTGDVPAVTLTSGATATAILLIQDVSAYSGIGNPCEPVTTAGLRVYPPNRYTSKIVPFPIGACSLPGQIFMTVRPVSG
jgi:Protein of unknown function (DUF4232)